MVPLYSVQSILIFWSTIFFQAGKKLQIIFAYLPRMMDTEKLCTVVKLHRNTRQFDWNIQAGKLDAVPTRNQTGAAHMGDK